MGKAADQFRLSKTGQWETVDSTPYGPLSRVRCPDTDHCLRLAPYEDGQIGPHVRNIPGRCGWVGAEVIDDRHDIPSKYLIGLGAVTGIDRMRWPG
ncbi:hypothetical protein [Nocardia abscessus]|uniref:hypothetical protein n=1 Tax=Nocardia abscessus TaxID=120957 RepID=UPI0002E56D27|nr:hypothetical protein [Nocardia abscessus]MCC3328680.1 hypothetical protein [Nocardia abscessus]